MSPGRDLIPKLLLTKEKVSEVKALSFHNLASRDLNRPPEDRSIVNEGVKLPILAAGIHSLRESLRERSDRIRDRKNSDSIF